MMIELPPGRTCRGCVPHGRHRELFPTSYKIEDVIAGHRVAPAFRPTMTAQVESFRMISDVRCEFF